MTLVRRRRGRSGAILLEVIVALTVLSMVGVTVVTLAAQSTRAIAEARSADRETAEASALLDAVALWSREDLDRHLGETRQGKWRLRVDRPDPVLYAVALTDSTGRATFLRTVLYRRETNRAQ